MVKSMTMAAVMRKQLCLALFLTYVTCTLCFRPAPTFLSSKNPVALKKTYFSKCYLARLNMCSAAGSEKKSEIKTGLRLFNTLSRDKQLFQPRKGRRVTMYTCGPTVYDFAHIGNFRAFLTYDLLKRWLLYCGYDVDHVCNLTDIDDKIIKRMQRDGVTLRDLTDKYAAAFMEDLGKLNIVPARAYPRATEYIDSIVRMINLLVSKGHAYEKDGSYYFDVASFPSYGKLARLDFENMQDGASEGGGITDPDSFAKRGTRDFALWKAFKPDDGEVFWDTPLGRGRPGWHIECSAMARDLLGEETLDIHCGGQDLTFPHHENEIAQSEACSGKPFCACWVHNGFVIVNREKMSKSLNNFKTVREALPTAEDCRAFRYLVISSQYRAPLNFAPDTLEGARNTLRRLDKWRTRLLQISTAAAASAAAAAASPGAAAGAAVGSAGAGAVPAGTGEEDAAAAEIAAAAADCRRGFEAGMQDDLNTPRACAALFSFIKVTESLLAAGRVGPAGAAAALSVISDVDRVLGVYYEVPGLAAAGGGGGDAGGEAEVGAEEVPGEVVGLLEERNRAKANKEWALADEIRNRIASHGYVIKDVKGGPSVLVKLVKTS